MAERMLSLCQPPPNSRHSRAGGNLLTHSKHYQPPTVSLRAKRGNPEPQTPALDCRVGVASSQ